MSQQKSIHDSSNQDEPLDVTVQNLTKRFGDLVAVDNISFNIKPGEFMTLVGPSGCGKTTTLRMVAGLETPTDGQIRFGEYDVTDLPAQERDAALLFQNIALYPHMTVRENMAYGLKIQGVDKAERNAKVKEAAEMLQIDDLLDEKPKKLSGGQQQRVGLGRPIVRDPTVFLFDEPMSDLDAKLKRELRPLFEEVTREIGCPTLYVTHDQEEAMTMSDRIIIMNDGHIEQIGTPEEVYNDPQTGFVGGFIGQPTMQFFEGELIDIGDSVSFAIDDHTWKISDIEQGSSYINNKVRAGIRPQHIGVVTGGESGSAMNLIPAEHSLDEPLGDETHSFFETDLGRITVVTAPDFRGEPDQDYHLQIKKEELKLFDAETDKRIR
jgi:multiple sugar transport system ATP-binding protein